MQAQLQAAEGANSHILESVQSQLEESETMHQSVVAELGRKMQSLQEQLAKGESGQQTFVSELQTELQTAQTDLNAAQTDLNAARAEALARQSVLAELESRAQSLQVHTASSTWKIQQLVSSDHLKMLAGKLSLECYCELLICLFPLTYAI